MTRQFYQSALAKIAWGYIFIYLDINFSVNSHAVSVLPKWAGFLLIFMALDAVALREPSTSVLKPLGLILTGEAAIGWGAALLGLDWDLPWIEILIAVVNLYFQFQLLTNLSDIAMRSGSAYGKRLKTLRTIQTVVLTLISGLAILPEQWMAELQQHPAIVIVAVGVQTVTAIVLVVTMFSYRKEQSWDLNLPGYVEQVLTALERAGHEAYVVGGCVRDTLMGREPADWDVCTSALPEETVACFGEKDTIPTGMKHGTVTVLMDGQPVEVTTYRIDGDYLDSRHPSKVAFTRSLEEDLQRRDFTMNAVAYCPSAGPVDTCGGRSDIAAGLIRCVGDPRKRFEEDALRILRALRFKATLGFMLEGETAKAVRNCRHLLTHISKERIQAELSKLVMGDHADSVLKSYYEVLETCAPGITGEIKGVSVEALPKDLAVRLAVLFPDETREALRALKYDNHTVKKAVAIARLLTERPMPPTDRIEVLRLLRDEGREVTELYYAAAAVLENGSGSSALSCLQEILEEDPCYSVEQLALSGGDLVQLGMKPGPEIGQLLKEMLDLVIEGKLDNNGSSLLDHGKERGVL